MAHFVRLNDSNIVVENIVVSNNAIKDENGVESEAIGINWCRKFKKDSSGNWKQTSYNSNRGVYYNAGTNVPHADQSKLFRKTFAEVGFHYDPTNDWFYPNKPLASFVWSEEHWDYRPPQAVPDDTKQWNWDEDLYNSTGNGWVERT